MQGSLGEKIGAGANAEVHAWAPGRVVKLFKPGTAPSLVRHEARTLRHVFAAGVPAPEMFEEVNLDGRLGIVMQRLDGPTLTQTVHNGVLNREQAGAILAALHMCVHKTAPPPRAPTLRGWIEMLSQAPNDLPKHIGPAALALIDRLQPADGLCHGDLQPNNVIMTAEGPKIVDWAFAMRAPAAADLACCHVQMFELAYAPEDIVPERPRAFNAALQAEYARLAGITPSALMVTIEPYLPILRALTLLLGGVPPHRRQGLIEGVEAVVPKQGALGEKIGEGVTADVYAWAPGQIVKLFKSGDLTRFGRHEAHMTRAAFAAGAPAPEVLDELMLEGRFGFVMPRLDGPTLQQLLQEGAVTPGQTGAILATLYAGVHEMRAPREIPSLRDWMGASMRRPGPLPSDLVPGILSLIDRLPPGDGLCHADLHPGNVIMTSDGPRIIDWGCALRAPGLFDIARAHISLSELVAENVDPELPPAINEAIQSEYARQTGISAAQLTAAMQPYLPVLRAFVIVQQRPATADQRDRLIGRIASALLSEN